MPKYLTITALILIGNQSQAQLTVALQATSPLCGGFSTGTILAIPSGGVSPYSYLWSNGSSNNPITGLPVGTYTVTVTDNVGTTATATTTLTSPPPLVVDISVITCSLPGAMTANVSGGVPPYMYMWETGHNTPTITGLSPGEYCITVMDNNSCGYVTCEYIGTPLSVQVTTTAVDCSDGQGGSATATPSGGVAPFTYLWNTGATTQTINDLTPGNYTVTVTAYNGCTKSGSATVGVTQGFFDFGLVVQHPTCNGFNNGQISTSVTGGIPPFTYLWSNGANTPTISNLTEGTYSLTVTDNLGCTDSEAVTLIDLSNITVTVNGQNPTCAGANNGSVSAFPASGVAPYSYLWNTGATTQTLANAGAGTYMVTVTDAVGCTATGSHTLTAPAGFTVNLNVTNASHCGATNGSITSMPTGGGSPPFSYLWSTGATSQNINNLGAGTYAVTVTSGQGCTASAQATVTQPTTLNINITGTSLLCLPANDGTLTANVTYGTAPYSFAWSNGGTTQTLTNLPPGSYSVTVTSSQGCVGSATKTITGNPAINLSLSTQSATCFGSANGQVTTNTTGGTAPFTYLWSSGQTTPNIFNVAAGNYTVTVTDNLGCTKVGMATVTQPNAIQITLNASPGSCGSNGSAQANVSGGTPGYGYLWNTGQTGSSLTNLPPGIYTVTVTDANNCTKTATANIPAYPALMLNVTSTNTTCNGTTDGTATANASGTGPFTYLWNTGATTASLSGLPPGNYTVTVTDANDCTAAGSATVMLGAGLNVTINAPTHVCPGTTASATAMATGGMGTYSYLWSNGQTGMTAVNLAAGTYTVTVTDPSNCTGTASVTLLPGGSFNIAVASQNVLCNGQSTGSISLTVTGTNPPFSYLWNNGATTATLQNLPAGNYTATVTDQTGCTQVESVVISQPPALSVSISAVNGTCGNQGSAGANVNGGTTPHTYLWSNGSTSPTISNLPAGTYSLTVTDGNGCTASASTQISVIPAPTCTVVLTQPITTMNGSNGQLTVQTTGGTSPYSYLWSNGQTGQTANNLSAGTYTVTVTDAMACTTVCSFQLFNPAKLGDFVWLDTDMDGIQDMGEPGLQGVSVTVSGTSVYGNTILSTVNTDANGMYMFLVQPGTYKLTFSPPANYDNSPQDAGGNDAIDSDVNPQTNMTQLYTLVSGETNLTIDAGFFESPCENVTFPGTICCNQTLCGPGNVPAPITQTAPATGGVGAIEYLWMYTNVPGPFNQNTWYAIPTATGQNYAPGALYETTYFVRCVRREGCTEFLESNQVVITIDDVAVAEIDGPNSTCVGDEVDFTSVNNGPEATYLWHFGSGATPATATTQNVNNVVWSTWGVKTITLQVENDGCTSYDTLLISVSNSPTFCGSALIINAEAVGQSSVDIEWAFPVSDTAGLVFSMEWALGNDDFNPIGGADVVQRSGSQLRFSKNHVAHRGLNRYRLAVTDDLGNVSYSNIEEVMLTFGVRLVHIYPNPFSENLKVEILERFEAAIMLELTDAAGRTLGVYEAPTDESYFSIPTEHLPQGIYFVAVKYGGNLQKIFKLVK